MAKEFVICTLKPVRQDPGVLRRSQLPTGGQGSQLDSVSTFSAHCLSLWCEETESRPGIFIQVIHGKQNSSTDHRET